MWLGFDWAGEWDPALIESRNKIQVQLRREMSYMFQWSREMWFRLNQGSTNKIDHETLQRIFTRFREKPKKRETASIWVLPGESHCRLVFELLRRNGWRYGKETRKLSCRSQRGEQLFPWSDPFLPTLQPKIWGFDSQSEFFHCRVSGKGERVSSSVEKIISDYIGLKKEGVFSPSFGVFFNAAALFKRGRSCV